MPSPDVNNGPPPVNYFADGSPGKGMAENVEDEKMKLLRLMAVRGSEGIAIYDEAKARVRAGSDQDQGAAVSAKGVTVPDTLIEETKRNFDQSQQVFRRIMDEQATAARADDVRRRSIEAIYKDSVVGAIPAERGLAQSGIDDYLKSLADAKKGRGGGGGGGGRGAGVYGDYFDEPTIDASFLTPVDMEGLLVSPAQHAVRVNRPTVDQRAIPTRANNPVKGVTQLAQRVLEAAAKQGKIQKPRTITRGGF